MSEVKKTGNKEVDELLEQWWEEAQPYLNHEIYPVTPGQLDGPNSWALVEIEKKYKKKIEELKNKEQEETDRNEHFPDYKKRKREQL